MALEFLLTALFISGCVKASVFLQKLVLFGPAFHTPWLESVGAIADGMGSDGRQKRVAPGFRREVGQLQQGTTRVSAGWIVEPQLIS